MRQSYSRIIHARNHWNELRAHKLLKPKTEKAGVGNAQAVEKNAGKITAHQKKRKRQRDYKREARASRARAPTPEVPP